MKLWLAALVLLTPGTLRAMDLAGVDVELSLAAEVVLPGTIVASWEIDFPEEQTSDLATRAVPLLKLTADVFVLTWLGPSLSLHYAPVLLQDDLALGTWGGRVHEIPRSGVHLLEVEAGVKGRWSPAEAIVLQSAVYFGFARTFAATADARNSGFIIDGVITGLWRLSHFHLLVNLGVMAQLYGGVVDVAYVKSGPMFYLGAGAGF